jgi:ethanolamine-phosphate cytidylyltransferase
MSSSMDPILPPGEPETKLLEGRMWVDGCFDFFHHGEPSRHKDPSSL